MLFTCVSIMWKKSLNSLTTSKLGFIFKLGITPPVVIAMNWRCNISSYFLREVSDSWLSFVMQM